MIGVIGIPMGSDPAHKEVERVKAKRKLGTINV